MTAQDLKNAILQLAVQGKLVPQQQSDESTSELLKRIKAQKDRLIKDGVVSTDKKHTPSPILEDDIPYDIPETWCWVKFADIVTFYSGKTPERHTSEYWNDGEYTWVSIADMVADGITIETKEKISEVALSDCFSKKISPAGTMIMSFKLTIGKVSILGIDAVHNEAIISIFPFVEDRQLKDYLFKILPFVANGGDSKNAIKGKTLNATSISNLMIPLPPIVEQQRIVEKIEELMPLVEEYRKAEERLTALNADFPDKLRKAILQQAIQGKLTERDPADAPASELLKRIRAEKERLIKDGKIKKEKPLPPITEEEIPFDIPDGWAWVRFYDVVDIASNLVNPEEYQSYMHIAPDNIEKGTGVLLPCRTVKTDSVASPNHLFYKGQLIYSKIRPLLRKAVIAPFDGLCSADMYPLNAWINLEYLQLILLSDFFNQQVARIIANRVKMPKINQNELGQTIFPLPPLAEQQRIVDRVNDLLAVCDELK